jgi:hypothetical protein
MAKPDIEVTCEYEVADDDVFLEVTIGNGNLGTTEVFLDGGEVDPEPGDDHRWRLGPGPELKDKTLEVDSVVHPVTSKKIVVTSHLTGGVKPGTCVAKGATQSSAPVTVQMLIDF